MDDLVSIPDLGNALIKLHNFDVELAERADLVIYSHRDLRDAIASMQRMFNVAPKLEIAEHLISQDAKWRKVADYVMRYEDFLVCPENILSGLCDLFGIKDLDISSINAKLNALSFDSSGEKNIRYNYQNLYHQGHVTNGKEGAWKGQLSEDFVALLERNYGDWFVSNGYVI
ncbi:hypothetical protein [Microbulbifer sp. SAOS-129_SWC]|uniref:hypothetical protein n=1 Tax=Microbulbifer sp. SAOS-129_SWC TaxID=3145235 RepID=UPI0032179C86